MYINATYTIKQKLEILISKIYSQLAISLTAYIVAINYL